MSKGLGHVGAQFSSDNIVDISVAAPKSLHDQYQVYSALPEITIAKITSGMDRKRPLGGEELKSLKKDQEYIKRVFQEDKELPKRVVMRRDSAPLPSEQQKKVVHISKNNPM